MSEVEATVHQALDLWLQAERTSLREAAQQLGLRYQTARTGSAPEAVVVEERQEWVTLLVNAQPIPELFTLEEAQRLGEASAAEVDLLCGLIETTHGPPGQENTTLDWWENAEPCWQHELIWLGQRYALTLRHHVSGLEQTHSLSFKVENLATGHTEDT
ncbi:hypothetical protein [Deinococcus radiotolerans]|uniref:Uncharacterized protein n=1 Tax=Deinococcus radiotolerans TaxID=1309407 RepID=A0ABQ2FKG1_9DEIO|nr:hypothetical protein [Deinococcus radiotolerans]GGL06675.1 hypothetical protein GCM10010844_26890 [Deinococcus radiotolerans]